jgi:hypothetical protein
MEIKIRLNIIFKKKAFLPRKDSRSTAVKEPVVL